MGGWGGGLGWGAGVGGRLDCFKYSSVCTERCTIIHTGYYTEQYTVFSMALCVVIVSWYIE